MPHDGPLVIEKPQKDQYSPQWIKENKEEFEDFDEDKKRNVLGEMMYKKVSMVNDIDPTQISKITGMLIDLEILDLEEILEMLMNEEFLRDRISEAMEIINENDE